MSAINQNRYDQLLRRVADLKGPGSKVNDALTELFPVIEVENVPSELLLPLGTRLCMGSIITVPGGAGFFCTHYLNNPVGTGVLATILQIFVFSNAVQDIVFGPTLNGDAEIGTRAVSDLRIFPTQPTCTTMGNNNLLLEGPANFRLRDNGTDGVMWNPPRGMAVLSPGTSFHIGCSSGNTDQRTSIFWTERPAQSSELNF